MPCIPPPALLYGRLVHFQQIETINFHHGSILLLYGRGKAVYENVFGCLHYHTLVKYVQSRRQAFSDEQGPSPQQTVISRLRAWDTQNLVNLLVLC